MAHVVRRALWGVKQRISDSYIQLRSSFILGIEPPQQHTMFEFGTLEDIDRFEINTDRVMGGSSVCSLSIAQTQGGTHAVFQGVLDNRCHETGAKGAGLCSFRTKPTARFHFLRSFDAIEMLVKTDGRPYMLYLKEAPSDGRRADDVFQAQINPPADRWVSIGCPFTDFVLTRQGAVAADQRKLNNARITGLALAARGEGPFNIQVKHVQAIYKWQAADFPSLAPPAARAALPGQTETQTPRQRSGVPAPHSASSIASLVEPQELRERRMHDTSYFRGE